jgi:hypothetical protein
MQKNSVMYLDWTEIAYKELHEDERHDLILYYFFPPVEK